MDQQVNLFQPILGAEKRLFSARAIALALAVFAVCLVALSAYGSRRTSAIERSIAEIEKQDEANVALAGRASEAVRPAKSVAELDAEAKSMSVDIDVRQRAIDVVRQSAATPATGFAARLEALAQRQPEGIWLEQVVLGSGEGRLAMRGATTDSALVPQYLAALAAEQALAGVRFDKLAMRRALPDEAPAQVIFELDGPGLPLPDPRSAK